MSEWKQSGIDRRDFRATKDDPVQRIGNRKKNTKKWCKGKEGREHTPVIELNPKWPWSTCNATSNFFPCMHHEICTTCGKELRWSLPTDECPILSTTTRP